MSKIEFAGIEDPKKIMDAVQLGSMYTALQQKFNSN
jgi:hypothetical protein